MENSQKSLTLGVIALAVVVLGGAYYFYFVPRPDVRRFTGDLVQVFSDTITVDGVFYDPEGKLPANLASQREFRFRADKSTIFWRTLIRKPSLEEFKSGVYFIDDLPKEEGPGTLQDLAASANLGSVYVEAEFPSSILTAKDPVASHIIYRVMIEPALPPSAE